ncbi:dTDP-4-dehydrorhamnose 3,5-epimerase family protein [Nocardiopsis mangrovi]|uniref:dTDP-4-dehydrorhamnose 3,5-epimerase family protein n=1 Tax=Nocardiopsis mangrovi TaxID=1179818 RepID=A0ABV9DRH3_9ACTN
MSAGVRELSIPGVLAFTPRVFPDERGVFVSPVQESAFTAATGAPLFHVAQTSYSVSRRGTVRGVHYTAAPPGMAKLVHCPQGRALDIVVDVRAGSPAFGRWESVVLDRVNAVTLYLPVGVGHMFAAEEDDTIMAYTMSAEYDPDRERAVSVFDSGLALPVPADPAPILSARDRRAPPLAQALADGLLPDYAACLAAAPAP